MTEAQAKCGAATADCRINLGLETPATDVYQIDLIYKDTAKDVSVYLLTEEG